MLHTKFQASELSGSEEEDCFNSFYVFLWFKPRTPLGVAVLDSGCHYLFNFGRGL